MFCVWMCVCVWKFPSAAQWRGLPLCIIVMLVAGNFQIHTHTHTHACKQAHTHALTCTHTHTHTIFFLVYGCSSGWPHSVYVLTDICYLFYIPYILFTFYAGFQRTCSGYVIRLTLFLTTPSNSRHQLRVFSVRVQGMCSGWPYFLQHFRIPDVLNLSSHCGHWWPHFKALQRFMLSIKAYPDLNQGTFCVTPSVFMVSGLYSNFNQTTGCAASSVFIVCGFYPIFNQSTGCVTSVVYFTVDAVKRHLTVRRNLRFWPSETNPQA